MLIRFALLFLLLAASHADAADLYKCAGPKNNAVSIQSQPCPAGSKQIWVRDGTPEASPTNQQLRSRAAKRRQDSEDARAMSQLAGTQSSSSRAFYQNTNNVDQVKARCENAKREALLIRDRDWKILTVDRLRQLDAWVESQCKR